MKKMDRRVVEAAEDLGANPRAGVLHAWSLPLSVPGVVSGITMVFMPAVTTFAISTLLGGGMTYPHRRHDREHVHDAEKLATYGSTISHDSAGGNHRSPSALLRKVDPDNQGGGLW